MDQGQPYAFRMLILFALCSDPHITHPSLPYSPAVIASEAETALHTTWTLDVLYFGTYSTDMMVRTKVFGYLPKFGSDFGTSKYQVP